jgi:CRP-like cAMP-binding protein
VFRGSSENIDRIAGHCRIEPYRKGQALLSAGERSSTVFVVVSGSAAAYHLHGGMRSLVEEFDPGELVLYKAFFRHGPSPFEVVASSDLEAITIPVSQIESLLASRPDIGSEVERMLSLREEAVRRAAVKTMPAILKSGSDTSREDILRELFRV